MNNLPAKNRGAALLLVLMITAAMMSIMLFMSEKGSTAARMANLIKANSAAKLKVDSQQAELINELMTTPLAVLGPTGSYNGMTIESPAVNSFAGEPTLVGELAISIQDTSGLVSVLPLNENAFKQLLLYHGVDEDSVMRILDRLADWQDQDSLRRLEGAEQGDYAEPALPTNMPLQTLEELRYILADDALFQALRPHLAMYSNPYIVRHFSPKSLYSAFGFEGSEENTNAEGSSVEMLPSRRLLLHISHRGTVNYGKRFVLTHGPGLRPYYINNEEILN